MKTVFTHLFGQSIKGRSIQPDETAQIEQLLLSQLAPVSPHPAYVNNLGKRLSDQTQPILIHRQFPEEEIGFWQTMLLITVGIVSGILLVLFGARVIISIFASRQATQDI